MTVQTNLRGRLRNTTLPLGNGLLPLFECVVNSIHAIEDRKASNGKIEISILRDKQRDLQFDDSKSTAAKRIGIDNESALTLLSGSNAADQPIDVLGRKRHQYQSLGLFHDINKLRFDFKFGLC